MSSERYTRNRNNWKRSYPRKKGKPVIETFIVNDVTQSINLQTYQRDTPYYRIFPDRGAVIPAPIPVPPLFWWEDGKYNIPGPSVENEYTITFQNQFNNPPVVCFAIFAGETSWPAGTINTVDIEGDDLSDFEDGKPLIYGVGVPTTTQVTFRLSHPYTGSIHYFAYDPVGAPGNRITIPNLNYWQPGPWQVSGDVAVSTVSDTSQSISWLNLDQAGSNVETRILLTPFDYVSNNQAAVVVLADSEAISFALNNDPLENSIPDTTNQTWIQYSASGSFFIHYIAFTIV